MWVGGLFSGLARPGNNDRVHGDVARALDDDKGRGEAPCPEQCDNGNGSVELYRCIPHIGSLSQRCNSACNRHLMDRIIGAKATSSGVDRKKQYRYGGIDTSGYGCV